MGEIAMQALKIILAGSVGLAALAGAAPAMAQYYPGYGYGANVVGQVPGYGYGNGYGSGYGVNTQAATNQCAGAVQARLGGGAGYAYNGYGYAGGRVLGISRVEPRADGVVVRGVANSGRAGAYGYAGQSPVDLTWRCRVDYRGYITDVSINRAQPNYGYGNYTPWNYDYSQYGYSRY
jgi:hypothetical protein